MRTTVKDLEQQIEHLNKKLETDTHKYALDNDSRIGIRVVLKDKKSNCHDSVSSAGTNRETEAFIWGMLAAIDLPRA